MAALAKSQKIDIEVYVSEYLCLEIGPAPKTVAELVAMIEDTILYQEEDEQIEHFRGMIASLDGLEALPPLLIHNDPMPCSSSKPSGTWILNIPQTGRIDELRVARAELARGARRAHRARRARNARR